jgi:hypothetical protein
MKVNIELRAGEAGVSSAEIGKELGKRIETIVGIAAGVNVAPRSQGRPCVLFYRKLR